MISVLSYKIMISNPITGRQIKIDGPTYKKLINAGYVLNGTVLSIPVDTSPKKILEPPFSIDIIPIVYSFLPLGDIVQGSLINRVFATAISQGYQLYSKSILSHMIPMKWAGKVLEYTEDLLSDNDILTFFANQPVTQYGNIYWKHVSNVQIHMGVNSRSWRLLDVFLLVKTGKGVQDHVHDKEYTFATRRSSRKIHNLEYTTERLLNPYPMSTVRYTSLEERILNNTATISDIQSACMKYGLSGYSKVNGTTKYSALIELQSLINN